MVTTQVKKQLTTKVWSHSVCGDFPCVICGEMHGQNLMACSLYRGPEIPGDIDDSNRPAFCEGIVGDICPECLGAGVEGAAQRLRGQAAEFREKADALEALADKLPEVDHWTTRAEFYLAAEERDR